MARNLTALRNKLLFPPVFNRANEIAEGHVIWLCKSMEPKEAIRGGWSSTTSNVSFIPKYFLLAAQPWKCLQILIEVQLWTLLLFENFSAWAEYTTDECILFTRGDLNTVAVSPR